MRNLILSILVLIFIIGGVFVYRNYSNKSQSPSQVAVDTSGSTTKEETGTNTPVVTTTQTSKYKDGKYTATGTYRTPETTEQITISVTIKDDVIIDSTFIGNPQAPESAKYQQTFAQNYKPYVIGKNIDSVNLTRVSGSSLTPKGFNDALQKIKVQAQA